MTYPDLQDPTAPSSPPEATEPSATPVTPEPPATAAPEPEEPAAPSVEPPGGPPSPPVAAPDRHRPGGRAAARLAVLALGSGIVLDIGLRGGPANAMVVVGLVLAVVALVVDDRAQQAEARWLALASLVPAAFLAVRVSPWLIASNLVTAGALVGAAICLTQSGSLLDITPVRLLHRALAGCGRALVPGLGVLVPLVPRVSPGMSDQARRIGLSLAITLPVLFVVVALLASADAVFAGLLSPDVALGPVIGHLVLTAVVTVGVVCAVAGSRGDTDDTKPPGRFGTVEVATMLGLATGVMAFFAVAQVIALTSAGDRLIEEAGLTPAEYARSGFFQLCWAAALIVVFLALVRGLAAPGVLDRPALRALGAAVPLLALGLVAVSIRRMALYDEAFGLTMLRLWVVGAAVWMGVVLVMIAVRNLGVGSGRDWLLAGATATALVLVLAADLANPEAFVVRHNVDRAAEGAELDATYLSQLSDDAVPAYTDAARTAPAHLRAELLGSLRCDDDPTGVAALNLSAARAADARDETC